MKNLMLAFFGIYLECQSEQNHEISENDVKVWDFCLCPYQTVIHRM